MDMTEVIAKINELARLAKERVLTAEELSERDKLRRIYIDAYKKSLTQQLDNTYFVEADGTKTKLKKK